MNRLLLVFTSLFPTRAAVWRQIQATVCCSSLMKGDFIKWQIAAGILTELRSSRGDILWLQTLPSPVIYGANSSHTGALIVRLKRGVTKVTGRKQLEKVGVWLYFTHKGFKRCSVCDFSTCFDWPILSNLEKDRKCDQGPRVGEGAGFSLVRFLKSYNDKCSLKNKNSLKYQNMTFLFLPELQQSTFSSLSLVFMFDDLFYL